MIKKARLKIPKKLRRDGEVWLPSTVREMGVVGDAAMGMIKKRVLKKQEDGTGKKFPKLVNRGWFWTSGNDTRFEGITERRLWRPDAFTHGQAKFKRLRNAILVHNKGFPDLKRRVAGKSPARRDGSLTGDMWRGFQAALKKVRGGWQIRLAFNGGTRVGKLQGWGNKTVRVVEDGTVKTKQIKVPKMKTQTIRNRDKARALQRAKGPKSKFVMALMSLTPQESQALAAIYLRLIKPFGEKVSSAPSVAGSMFRK